MRFALENVLDPALSRRTFLKSAAAGAGVFLIGVHVPFATRAIAQEATPPPNVDPNMFLRIDPDGTVTIISKHFEMGQGASTGMATLVAEELGADWSKVRIAFAPNNPKVYNNLAFGTFQGTGGSTATAEAWEQMRTVGAGARMMLVAAAAARWGVSPNEITVDKGVVAHSASGKRASFGDLAVEAMQVPVPTDVPLKTPKEWKLIGSRLPRLDSVAKTTGTAMFAMDVRRPGMLTAVVARPPRFGATVASFDAAPAKAITGVVDVVQVPSGVAVLAKDTWSAMRGRDALKVTWDESKAETRSTEEMLAEYRKLAATPGLNAGRRGDAATKLASAAKTVEAEFTLPFLAHAPMEPMNGVMELRADGAEIWSGCQLHSIDEIVAAQVLGFQPAQIHINTLFAGGSFGRRGNSVGDWTAELAAITKAIGGRAPVHLVWTREDDIHGGFYRPMVLHKIKAGVDAQGALSGWQHTIVCKSILTGTPFESFGVKDGVDGSSVEGVADTPYAIGDFSVDLHNAQTAVPVLWWRSVGHSHTATAMEMTIDELARLAGKDPVAFRIDLLAKDPRAAAVVKLAAEKGGWGEKLPAGRGRGIAYHMSFGTRVALVADVTVEGPRIDVDRVVAVVDCGIAVNPDLVVAQVEGAVGFALSAVLRNEVTLDKGQIQQSNFHDYEPTRISDMPVVQVHIVPSTEKPSGIGEPGVPPLVPAIGNAVYAATGKRLRSVPFRLG